MAVVIEDHLAVELGEIHQANTSRGLAHGSLQLVDLGHACCSSANEARAVAGTPSSSISGIAQ